MDIDVRHRGLRLFNDIPSSGDNKIIYILSVPYNIVMHICETRKIYNIVWKVIILLGRRCVGDLNVVILFKLSNQIVLNNNPATYI
jgi:hypothetical protein